MRRHLSKVRFFSVCGQLCNERIPTHENLLFPNGFQLSEDEFESLRPDHFLNDNGHSAARGVVTQLPMTLLDLV